MRKILQTILPSEKLLIKMSNLQSPEISKTGDFSLIMYYKFY